MSAPIRVPEDVRTELAAGETPTGDPFDPLKAGALTATAAFCRVIRQRLARDPGFVLLTGFPVGDSDDEHTQAAFSAFGRLIGHPMPQNRSGDHLVRVADAGAHIRIPTHRGHQSRDELAYHSDRTDVIGLLCVRTAREGGISRIVSSAAVHEIMRREHPSLLGELYRPLPQDRRGEQSPGEPPWCEMPIFWRDRGRVAARYVRRFIADSQRHDDAPRLTEQQIRALDALDEALSRLGLAYEMDLAPGEVQLIDNFRVLHARTAFVDPPDAPGRLLLRFWLSWEHSPQLPPSFARLYGSCVAGAVRGGVWPDGFGPQIGVAANVRN